MFYEDLYTELGRLFYHVASIDGKVAGPEKQTLQRLVDANWKPLETSVDEFGTDQANLINFAFDYEEAEDVGENRLRAFESFYSNNKSKFTPAIKKNIQQTSQAIADSYRSRNKHEKQVLEWLKQLLSH